VKKAYVLINCDLGKEEKILETLRSIKSVKEAHGTFGAYDIIVEVSAKNAEDLREDITWKIRRLPDIRSTLTLTGIEGLC
jgi:DNA-binding Lrp family transcriptional regulator